MLKKNVNTTYILTVYTFLGCGEGLREWLRQAGGGGGAGTKRKKKRENERVGSGSGSVAKARETSPPRSGGPCHCCKARVYPGGFVRKRITYLRIYQHLV